MNAPKLMLCSLIDAPFDDPNWVFEPKLDGLRVLCRFNGRRIELLSRNGKSQEAQFPDIVEGLRGSLRGPIELDGEIVCLDEEGKSSFRALQQRFHVQDAAVVRARAAEHPAYFYVFDVLSAGKRDLRKLTLRERRRVLQQSVTWSDRIRLVPEIRGEGAEVFERACAHREEGIVAKNLESRYTGERDGSWVKIKCLGRQELVIGGFTDPQRSRVGLGALLVGYFENGTLRYAGKVGTGFDKSALLSLRRRLGKLERRQSPFAQGEGPGGTGVHWVAPELVAEIAFAEWTQNGLLRQPRFEGLREDKRARQVRKENPMALDEYRRKRDFKKTPEPGPRIARKKAKAPIFVVQEHHASHLHYDFRLEVGGVLKSWAVPKEPSTDPSVKRLAVEVEDHPLGYASFEGTIPKGEYGAGEVSIWDHGTFEGPEDPEAAIEAGHLDFVLHGERLRGAYALVRTRLRGGSKPSWLLIKRREAGRGAPARPKVARLKAAPANEEALRFTHTDKVLFPKIGVTKGDVLAYYEEVADLLLPYLRGRPITLERLPEGLVSPKAPHFWQKNTPKYYPAWIPRVKLPAGRGKSVEYALVNDRETLLYLVNQGALTFHVWASRVEDLDRPDFVLFDLDPGKASFATLVRVARRLHDLLEAKGIDSNVKTSGKSGLHVFVPWHQKGDHDDARAWALEIARELVEECGGEAECGDIATTERSKNARGKRVYVDVMQNAKGHHVVPPYVIRPTPTATISMPIEWSEVNARLDPRKFTVLSFRKRERGKKAA